MDLLKSLHLDAKNSGASTSQHWWSHHKDDGEIISYSPATGEAIASVYRASEKITSTF